MVGIETSEARRHSPARTRKRASSPASSAPEDVLVFEHRDDGFDLIGGVGRGASWAGIVRLELDEPSLVTRAWRRGMTERSSGPRPTQVAGPYYARHAVAMPVGHDHVVVLGSSRPITARDADVLRLAAATVDQMRGVPADKLLADELEVVDTLRTLMAYRPTTVTETGRHIATVAARALSCELALIRLEHDGQVVLEGIDLRMPESSAMGGDAEEYLSHAATATGPDVEQAASAHPDVFGVEVAARMTLPFMIGSTTGALALGHAATQPRGFTSLCQRIGRAIAETAELLISQAETREQLAAERDLLARLSGTDPLTGLGNRRAWDDLALRIRAVPGTEPCHVLSCDLDDLKAVNDRHGHAAGDALIRAAANLLRSSIRDRDEVARVGGDEFAALLFGADEEGAGAVIGRIRRAERVWRVTEHGLAPRMSMGVARVQDGDIEAARVLADRMMYENKRRRSRTQRRKAPIAVERRRGASPSASPAARRSQRGT